MDNKSSVRVDIDLRGKNDYCVKLQNNILFDYYLEKSGKKAIDFLKKLLDAWHNSWKKEKKEGREMLNSLFGEENQNLFGKKLLYTLTKDGKQLRAWFGHPAEFAPNHVDSCGDSLLFSVYGDKEEIEKVVEELEIPFSDNRIVLPNGVTILNLHISKN